MGQGLEVVFMLKARSCVLFFTLFSSLSVSHMPPRDHWTATNACRQTVLRKCQVMQSLSHCFQISFKLGPTEHLAATGICTSPWLCQLILTNQMVYIMERLVVS